MSTSTAVYQRFHYLDQIRAITMLSLVYLHGCLAYAVGNDGTLIRDTSDSVGLSIFFIFTHLFRMALLYLVAGFFACLILQKKGVKEFLRNRMVRIGLPFLLFMPIVLLVEESVIVFVEKFYGAEKSTEILGFTSVLGRESISTGHLWFLYYLALFCAIAALVKSFRLNFLSNYMSRIFNSPWHLLYLPLFLIPALYSVPVFTPAPHSLVPELWVFGFYGLFFFAGWHFYHHTGFLEKLKAWIWPMTIYCTLAFLLFLGVIQRLDGNLSTSTPVGALATILEAYLGLYLVVLCLYAGSKVLNFENRFARYLSDSSYWVYIVHQPLLWIVQAYMVSFQWPGLVKFFASTAIVVIVSMVMYEYLIRYTIVGTMLNGPRKKRTKISVEAQPSLSE